MQLFVLFCVNLNVYCVVSTTLVFTIDCSVGIYICVGFCVKLIIFQDLWCDGWILVGYMRKFDFLIEY